VARPHASSMIPARYIAVTSGSPRASAPCPELRHSSGCPRQPPGSFASQKNALSRQPLSEFFLRIPLAIQMLNQFHGCRSFRPAAEAPPPVGEASGPLPKLLARCRSFAGRCRSSAVRWRSFGGAAEALSPPGVAVPRLAEAFPALISLSESAPVGAGVGCGRIRRWRCWPSFGAGRRRGTGVGRRSWTGIRHRAALGAGRFHATV